MKKQSQIGTWSVIDNSDIIEIIGLADYDFVIIDFEHGHHSLTNLANHVRASHLNSMKAYARPREINKKEILQLLEANVDGIFVPDVRTVEDAKLITDSCFYPPMGTRGASGFTKSSKYGKLSFSIHKKIANKKIFVCILIESEEGLKNIKDIVIQNKQIDCVYFGTYDLMNELQLFDKNKKNLNFFEKILIKKIIEIKKIKPSMKFGRVVHDKKEASKFKKYYDLMALKVDCNLILDSFLKAKL
mgnify:CR=1 FL=1